MTLPLSCVVLFTLLGTVGLWELGGAGSRNLCRLNGLVCWNLGTQNELVGMAVYSTLRNLEPNKG